MTLWWRARRAGGGGPVLCVPAARPEHGRVLQGGWTALARDALGLRAGQVIEVTREGDGMGWPGEWVVSVRVVGSVGSE